MAKRTIDVSTPNSGQGTELRSSMVMINENFNEVYGANFVTEAMLNDNIVGAAELKVSDNGSDGQVLKSAGNGTFSWGDFLPLSGGTMTGTGSVKMPDDFKLQLGTGDDAEIYHDGTNFIVKNTEGQFNIQQAKVGSNITFKTSSSTALDTEALTISPEGNADFHGKASSAQTDSNDTSSTLTTKSYIDGLITGATIYKGTWNASASDNSGYGTPDLDTVTKVSGFYYICSADGSAYPNGAGNEPNTWSVGDWVIWNDSFGTSGEWQKIDNSSVLSGVGTGQTVALWQGDSSVPDSETIGNAPITVIGNNTTFAGNVTSPTFIGDLNGTINTATTATTQDAAINNTTIATTAFANAAAGAVPIADYLPLAGGTLTGALTGTAATFAGNVTVKGALNLWGANSALAGQILENSVDGGLYISAAGTNQDIRLAPSGTGIVQSTKQLDVLGTLTGTTATFTGDINISNSDARLKGGDATGRFIVSNSDTTSYISLNGSSNASPNDISIITDEEIIFNTGSGYSEAMRISNSGNVGIGTSSPNSAVLLDLKEPDAGNDLILGLTAGTGARAQIRSGAQADSTSSELSFHTVTGGSTSERMRINSQGQTWLGGTFTGNDIADSPHAYLNNLNAGAFSVLHRNSADAYIHFNSYYKHTGDYVAKYNGTAFRIDAPANNNGLAINKAPTKVAGQTQSFSSVMTIGYGNNNNVGIGTTSPEARLVVASADSDGIDFLYDTNNAYKHQIKNYWNSSTDSRMDFNIGRTANVAPVTVMSVGYNSNVGIGTTSPLVALHVVNTNDADSGFTLNKVGGNDWNYIKFKDDAVDEWSVGTDANSSFFISNYIGGYDQHFTILANGNVGIGTDSPKSKLHVDGNVQMENGGMLSFYSGVGTNAENVGIKGTDATGTMQFYTEAVERMRITSAGDFEFKNGTLKVGDSTTAELLIIPSSDGQAPALLQFHKTDTATQTVLQFLQDNSQKGSIAYDNTSTSYFTTSDYRLKEDLQDFNGLDMISNIPVYDFKWKTDESRSYGVMAHELQEVLPNAVVGEKDAIEEYEITPAVLDEEGNVSEEAVMGTRDNTQGVDYSKVVPLLIKSIQELTAEIELLKAR